MDLSGDRWQLKKKKTQKEPVQAPSQTPSQAQSSRFQVFVTPEAQKSLDELPGNIHKAMADKIAALEGYPEVAGVKRMWGEAYGKQRLKFWDWRMEFSVDMKIKMIVIEKIGHRDSTYDEYHHA